MGTAGDGAPVSEPPRAGAGGSASTAVEEARTPPEARIASRMDVLRQSPLWGTVPPEILQWVADSMQGLRFSPGETVLRTGERGSRLHMVVRGRLRVEVLAAEDVRVTVAHLGPGDCFGEMSMLTGDPASADVVVEEEAETLALDRGAFNALILRHPGLLLDLTTLISRRLHTADQAFGAAKGKEREFTHFLQDDRSGESSVLVGQDKAVRGLDRRIQDLAREQGPVLVLGEPGTGKEIVARRIHFGSSRRDRPLLAADCGRITETQWGDSLFGDYHRKDGRPHPRALCYMDLAEGGTLLLKNVDALPPPVLRRLGTYLEKEGIGGVRRDVRILATLRDAGGGGDGLPPACRGLPEPLVRSRLFVPPLRARKRDIPRLAENCLRKRAARMGTPVPVLDEQAVVKLVMHDYAHGNVRELEEALERAATLAGGNAISAEEIFLSRPARSAPGGLDLLRLPRPLVDLALRAYPGAVRLLVAAVFAALVFLCFFMPATEAGRTALLLVWSVWWPALALSFLLVGRVWCSLCPMAFAGSRLQGLSSSRRTIPAWMKDRGPWLVAGGFFLILWIEEVTAMRRSPLATGILLLAILGGAVVTGLLYPRRTWCRHLCPLGGLASVCSTTSLLEVRPTPDICEAKCTGHLCYKGNEERGSEGCPMFHHVMFLDTNQHCVLCMSCVRSCPNGSPRVQVRLPARELWSDLRARPEAGWFTAMLVGLLLALGMAAHWEAVPSPPFSDWLEGHRFAFLTVLFAVLAAVPMALLFRALRRIPPEADAAAPVRFWSRVNAWLPLVAGGFAAYQAAFLPGLGGLQTRVGYESLGEGFWVTSRVLLLVQLLLLGSGLLLTLLIQWRAAEWGGGGGGRAGLRYALPGMAGAAGWGLLLAGLLCGPPWFSDLSAPVAGASVLIAGLSFRLSLGGFRR